MKLKKSDIKDIVIYVDGSCKNNPGVGGVGIVFVTKTGKFLFKSCCGYKLTTNNRMELISINLALDMLKRRNKYLNSIEIYSDSRYAIDPINKGWLNAWEFKNFRGKSNPDIWKDFINLYRDVSGLIKDIKFIWEPREESLGNILADTLAKKNKTNLRIDRGYHENILRMERRIKF